MKNQAFHLWHELEQGMEKLECAVIPLYLFTICVVRALNSTLYKREYDAA